MVKKILIVDDESKIRRVIQAYLESEGYQVASASNGKEALYLVRQDKPDLILLDLMMPEMDGYEFMFAMRKEADIPVIIMTAKGDESDEVLGLELGADDYVVKPFSNRGLLARVRAVLSRYGLSQNERQVLRAGALELDLAGRKVTVDGNPIELTPTEFELLAVLMWEPGIAYSRYDLLEKLPGEAFAGVERSIDVHVSNLRNKIETDPKNPIYIETVYGMGYRFGLKD